jgi:hypothetical protein
MKEEYEVKVVSSAGQFTDFLESTVWADMKRELHVWLEGVRDGLEDPEADEKGRLINVGRADALKYFMSMPETIRDTLLEEHSAPEERETKSNEMEDFLDE